MSDHESTDDDAPDWSLLPRDPVGFFGLGDGFDRKDLKRSYNRLLRQYKPEKYPEEFQRLRAAFEELERRLRYGHTTEASTSDWGESVGPADPETVIDAPARIAGEAALPKATDLESLAKQLEAGETTVEQLYERLKKLPTKTPPDFYALALMADATGPPEKLLLLSWLLKGLAEWPGDPALSRLVYAYLGTQTPVERLPQVLVECSKAVPGDAFFELTEGGWDRLLRGGSFDTFSKTLARCEEAHREEQLKASRDPSISGRLAFYIHALRFALWKDPTDWKTQAWEFVEENYDQAPEHLENDFDALGIVREYLAHRDEFTQGHPLRLRMDQVLELAFTADQLEADRAVLAMQAEFVESPEALSAAFPPEPSEASSTFYTLWAWMSHDTASRYAPPVESEPDYRMWQGRIIELLHRLQHQGSFDKTIWDLAAAVKGFAEIFGLVLFAILSCAAVLFLYMGIGAAAWPNASGEAIVIGVVLSLIVSVAVAIYFMRRWPKWLDSRVWSPYCRRMAWRRYRRSWRPEFFAFLDRSLLDYFAFRDIASDIAEQHGDERTWMSHFITQDYGLAFYSIAQRFRT